MKINIIYQQQLYIILFFSCFIVSGQDAAIKPDLPTVMSPSPSVAGLMKFEEVPVSNYTGVPDISIPLFSTGTHSKDINLNIALKYHPSGVAADEKASDVGLGWSLFAGGTISRTVRGLPDEIYDTRGVTNGGGKIGLYHTTSTYRNNYESVVDFADIGAIDDNHLERVDEFLWHTTERGMYDTEHDLWQYNFMGKTGRFTIRKNRATNLLEVTRLNLDSNVKIINIYDPVTLAPISFQIYDDLGNKYIFDVREITDSNSTTTITHQASWIGMISTATPDITYSSAFHLSVVQDTNQNNILSVVYNNEDERYIEILIDKSVVANTDAIGSIPEFLYMARNVIGYSDSQITNLDPLHTQTLSQRRINTKKIKQIAVEGKCRVDFNFTRGREDENFTHPQNSYIFKGVTVKDWNNNTIKIISLDHFYSTTIEKRMMLGAVNFENTIDNKKETYTLEYKQKDLHYGGLIGKDRWGYFNVQPAVVTRAERYMETTREVVTVETLQKMTLPTGGCTIFQFEPNTYSYSGDTAFTNFDNNPYNFNEGWANQGFTSLSDIRYDFFTISHQQDMTFTTSVNTNGQTFSDLRFNIYRQDGTSYIYVGAVDYFNCPDSNTCNQELRGLAPGSYKVSLSSLDESFPRSGFTATIDAAYKYRNDNNYQFFYGGGNRIKKIGYFKDSNIPQNYYEIPQTIVPDKEKEFSYSKRENPSLSSGSLVSGTPIFDFNFTRSYLFYSDCTGGACSINTFEFHFKKHTDTNNLRAIKTGGSDVGYQDVTVKESNNGRIEYTYTSPIDYPEGANDGVSDVFPFVPTSNFDYKRGLLKKEQVFHNDNKLLSETAHIYDFTEAPEAATRYGVMTNYFYNIPYMWLFGDYGTFQSFNTFMDTCTGGSFNGIVLCGPRIVPRFYVRMNWLHEANGWAKLMSKTTKNYFYTDGVRSGMAEVNESYTYNPLNKKWATRSVINSQGETLRTDYTYDTRNSAFTQNRISAIATIEEFKNNTLTGTSRIDYVNTFDTNTSYLPQTIAVSKGALSPETRLRYTAYDAYGNPLEVQQENGIPIAYIWGYNQTQPIAKIENATYASLELQIANLQELSNTGTEADLIAALDALRASLPNVMVTTYTYKPLVGISTMTDPKGNRMNYVYDSFNRLAAIRDKDDKILTENQYHYRTQN